MPKKKVSLPKGRHGRTFHPIQERFILRLKQKGYSVDAAIAISTSQLKKYGYLSKAGELTKKGNKRQGVLSKQSKRTKNDTPKKVTK
jgi:hypothetical protein